MELSKVDRHLGIQDKKAIDTIAIKKDMPQNKCNNGTKMFHSKTNTTLEF